MTCIFKNICQDIDGSLQLFVIIKKKNNLNVHAQEPVNKLWYMHTMEPHVVNKNNKAGLHV